MIKKDIAGKVYDILTERALRSLFILGNLYNEGYKVETAIADLTNQTLQYFADEGAVFAVVDDFSGFGDEEYVTIIKDVRGEFEIINTDCSVLFTEKDLFNAWSGVIETNFVLLNGNLLYFHLAEGMVWKNADGESLTAVRGTTDRFVTAVWSDAKGASLKVHGDVSDIAAFVFAHKMKIIRRHNEEKQVFL